MQIRMFSCVVAWAMAMPFFCFTPPSRALAQDDPFGSPGAPAGGGALGAAPGIISSVDLRLFKFDGFLRVTYEEKVAGVVLQSKSMAGMIISLEPFTVATCSSIMNEEDGRKKLDVPQDTVRSFRFELLKIPAQSDPNNDPFNSGGDGGGSPYGGGGGYGSAAGGSGGAGAGYGGGMGAPLAYGYGTNGTYGGTIVEAIKAMKVNISHSPVTLAGGLVFFSDPTVDFQPTGMFQPVDLSLSSLAKSSTDEKGFIFHLSLSPIPTYVSFENNSIKTGNFDGQFCLSSQGFDSYFCDGKWLYRDDILAAFLEARKSLGSQPPSSQQGPATSDASTLTDINSMVERIAANSSSGPGSRNRESLQHLETLVPMIVRFKQSKDDAEKQAALAELRNAIAIEFDAQRKVRSVELNSMRQRLDKLESEEQSMVASKNDVIEERIKLLTQ